MAHFIRTWTKYQEAVYVSAEEDYVCMVKGDHCQMLYGDGSIRLIGAAAARTRGVLITTNPLSLSIGGSLPGNAFKHLVLLETRLSSLFRCFKIGLLYSLDAFWLLFTLIHFIGYCCSSNFCRGLPFCWNLANTSLCISMVHLCLTTAFVLD